MTNKLRRLTQTKKAYTETKPEPFLLAISTRICGHTRGTGACILTYIETTQTQQSVLKSKAKSNQKTNLNL